MDGLAQLAQLAVRGLMEQNRAARTTTLRRALELAEERSLLGGNDWERTVEEVTVEAGREGGSSAA